MLTLKVNLNKTPVRPTRIRRDSLCDGSGGGPLPAARRRGVPSISEIIGENITGELRCRHGNIPLGLPAFQLLGQEALLAAKVPQKASEQTHSLAFNFRLRGIVVGWVRANKREAKKKKVQSLDTDRTNRKINWNQKKKNPRRNSKGRSSLLSLWNYAGYSVSSTKVLIIGGCLGRYILVFVQQ